MSPLRKAKVGILAMMFTVRNGPDMRKLEDTRLTEESLSNIRHRRDVHDPLGDSPRGERGVSRSNHAARERNGIDRDDLVVPRTKVTCATTTRSSQRVATGRPFVIERQRALCRGRNAPRGIRLWEPRVELVRPRSARI